MPSKENVRIANPDRATQQRPAQFAGDRCRRNTSLASALEEFHCDSHLKHSHRMPQDQLKKMSLLRPTHRNRRMAREACPQSDHFFLAGSSLILWNSMLKVTSLSCQGKGYPNLQCFVGTGLPHCGCFQYKLHLKSYEVRNGDLRSAFQGALKTLQPFTI